MWRRIGQLAAEHAAEQARGAPCAAGAGLAFGRDEHLDTAANVHR